ncbi:MAG: hypothetical protein WA373_10145 [Burkholderiales bacterium]
MPFDSASGEPLARFITQKNYVRPDNTVKHTPFMPSTKTWRLSVYKISGVSEAEIWSIGKTYVAEPLGKPIHGRADLSSFWVYDAGLSVQSVPEPHPLHADIIGWDPASTAPRLQALKLAGKSAFRPLPAT